MFLPSEFLQLTLPREYKWLLRAEPARMTQTISEEA